MFSEVEGRVTVSTMTPHVFPGCGGDLCSV